jgi:hypothetical protein
MEKYSGYLKNPKYTATAAFILGLFIGLVVLGWGLFPVQWTDAAPSNLSHDYQLDYLKMTVVTYDADGDQQMALMRWEALGEDAPDLLLELQQDPSVDQEALKNFSEDVVGGAPATENEGQIPTVPVEVSGTETESGTGTSPVILLLVACLLTLLVGGALVYVLFIRRKRKSPGKPSSVETTPYTPAEAPVETVDSVDTGLDKAVANFTTVYTAGDELYDDSYSIDSQSGEFLGECGVTISETIGVGEPKKVNAFEIWLFDKNDIQTITKVLLSENSYNDESFRKRMMAKGEPILVQPGSQIILETATLQLEAHIVNLSYGVSAMPENSYFEKLSIELSVWPKK